MDIDALRNENEDLRRQLADSIPRSFFDGMLDAILVVDHERVIRDANAAACELVGLTREPLLGRRIDDLLGADACARALRDARSCRTPLTLQRADGTTRIVELSGAAEIAPGRHLTSWRDVTEHAAKDEALRRSEARFRAMIEKSQDGITLLGPDVRNIYQSPAVERLLGYTLEEAQQMDWKDFTDEEEHAKLGKALAEVMAGPGAATSLEFRIRRRDGAQRWLELTATNLLHDPDVGALVTNFRDITERRSLGTDIENFFALSLDLFCIASVDGYFRRLNPAWEFTVGWSLDELCAKPWLELVHPEDREATIEAGSRLTQGDPVVRFENRYLCKDGRYRRLLWTSMPGPHGAIYACARDVTDERAAAERDRLLFWASPLPMTLVDAETFRFLDVNDAAVKAYGYSRAELLGLGLRDIVVGDDVLARRRQHRTKGGELRDVDVTSHRLEIGGRSTLLNVVLDVTDAKRLEEERERYVERLRLLETCISRLNDCVIITRAAPLSDPGPEILYVNDAVTRVTGYSREELIGRTPRIFQGPETDRATLDTIRTALARGELVRAELQNYTKSGAPFWMELDIAPVVDRTGTLTHFVAVERDITEKRRSEEALRQSEQRLRQAQKMEAIGTLAAGVAHDFNNLLSVILSYTSLILDETSQADPLFHDLEEVHKAGERAGELTRQLLAFSRKQMLQPSVVEINTVVGNLRKMLGRVLGEDIELVIVASPDAGKVFGDPGQIEQVLLNLVVNARDAMPNGGTLTIETANVVLEDADAVSHGGAAPGSYVLVTVTDTGTGMDRATRERVFEPFFTTKERGKGTGLGLSTVYGIVQQSGGHIWLYSEVGLGTTFKIYLPRTDRPLDADAGEPAASVVVGGTETILLVEDEDQVRELIGAILRRNGYHVLEAQNAGEALLLCEQFTAKIHLLVTDVVMPRMTGKQLADRLARLRPEMRRLFISGYTENTVIHHGVLDAGVDFLAKPILPDVFLKKVRRVLDGAERPTTRRPA